MGKQKGAAHRRQKAHRRAVKEAKMHPPPPPGGFAPSTWENASPRTRVLMGNLTPEQRAQVFPKVRTDEKPVNLEHLESHVETAQPE